MYNNREALEGTWYAGNSQKVNPSGVQYRLLRSSGLKGGDIVSGVKDFMLGFFVAASFGFLLYTIWEYKRHVPVVIKQVPVPIQMMPNPSSDIETWET